MGALRDRLTSLYVVGKEVEFDLDDGDEPVKIWVQKLNPIQKEAVIRQANSKRQSVLALKKRPENDESVKPYIDEIINTFNERELMIEFLEAEDIQNAIAKIEEEVSHRSEWEEDGYLLGLQDAWEGGLKETWLVDKDDVEAVRVYEEVKRWADQVEEEMSHIRKQIHRDYDNVPDEELTRQLMMRAIEVQADIKWLEIYRRGEIQYAVREPSDHTTLVFDSYADIENLQPQVFDKIYEEYQKLIVSPVEGKD